MIQLISVATDRDQAGLLYREASPGTSPSAISSEPYAANATQSFATFQTPFDIERYGSYSDNQKARYSINVTFPVLCCEGASWWCQHPRGVGRGCSLRGEGTGQLPTRCTRLSSRVHGHSAPRIQRTQPVPIGENEGRIILISSPLGKQGSVFQAVPCWVSAATKQPTTCMCIQAPTWEVNPTVPAETFVASYLKDPNVFFTEFGAEFTDRTKGWITDKADLMACVDAKLRPQAPCAFPYAPSLHGPRCRVGG